MSKSGVARNWGFCPEGVTGALPKEYMIMAIGVKGDHIFQGTIYGQPRHLLMLAAVNHAFSKTILSKVANLEYMIFCKELWKLLGNDLGHAPQTGWNQSKRYDLSPAGEALHGLEANKGAQQRRPLF